MRQRQHAGVPAAMLEKYRKLQGGRTSVEPGVLSVISKIAKKRLEIPPIPTGIQKRKLEILSSGVIQAGVGIDLEKSRLRQMRYTRLTVEERELSHRMRYDIGASESRALCLVGYTDQVYMEELSGNTVTGIWDVGTYQIIIPIPDILHKKIDRIAFIPDLSPETTERHPHHRKGHTCWDTFADSVLGAMNFCEIAELFRVLRIFTGRWSTAHELTISFQRFATPVVKWEWTGNKYQYNEVVHAD